MEMIDEHGRRITSKDANGWEEDSFWLHLQQQALKPLKDTLEAAYHSYKTEFYDPAEDKEPAYFEPALTWDDIWPLIAFVENVREQPKPDPAPF